MNGSTMTRDQAQTRAEQIFYGHAAIFVVANAVMAYVDLTSTPDRLWFIWPLLGWGAGLVAHAVGVFVTHKAADRVLKRVARRTERAEARSHHA